MLQASLKVQVLIFLLRLFKILFRRHAQIGARIKVDSSNVKHRGGPSLPEAVGVYVCPLICRHYYLSRLPYYSGCPVNRPPYCIRAAVGFSSFLPRSSPGPLPLHCPTIDFRLVGDSAREEGPGSEGTPLLCGGVMPRKNKAPIWA